MNAVIISSSHYTTREALCSSAPISPITNHPVMISDEDVGARLLVTRIDKLATEPSRVWASIPVDDEDLSKGFKDVTYTAFANAINRAASWLHDQLPPVARPFETVAYSGPKDIRYPIFAVAVAKIGRKVLFFKHI